VDTFSFFKFRFLASEKQMAIIVFVICISVRAVPGLAAYPHPIGYDVVNYYIPKVVNFQEEWSTISKQFPLYVTFLYSLSTPIGLSSPAVVTSVAVVMAGIFGMSLFYIGRRLLNLQLMQSVFLVTFIIFQMAVLRTFWDLHRDVMALAAMLFVFSLLGRNDTGWKVLSITLALTAITVAVDKMIGALLCISLAAYLVITRRKDVALIAILAISLFSILMVTSYQPGYPNNNTIIGETSGIKTPEFYNQGNLLIFFLVVNCLVAAPAKQQA
jgi:predicted neutral ceramidase superfamily lipid hydrolase